MTTVLIMATVTRKRRNMVIMNQNIRMDMVIATAINIHPETAEGVEGKGPVVDMVVDMVVRVHPISLKWKIVDMAPMRGK
jgi:hypothetical protein